MNKPLAYRPCVLGVFRNKEGKVLICERSDPRGQWQLPQGGVDKDESEGNAIIREMSEELGTTKFKVIFTAKEYVAYDFPPEYNRPKAKLYRGQRQKWFLLEFTEGALPNLKDAHSEEFVDWKWVTIKEAIEEIVFWKRKAYVDGFKSLNLD